ncbi:hypothetical protein E4U56_006680 [Claviceps arundinis]|uniref:Heme oxygenase n=2 Tax=Claviceps arundinis TaxID=1623583 RepID=A0A9P7MVV1_9HYPO|nr:hypothetical protein E4U56_006680 [Claviceps arundinis]
MAFKSTRTEMDMTSPGLLEMFSKDRPLAESITLATRPIHAKLNKLVIARLPLALPPLATSSLVYASGLMHIAPIYSTFETAWSDILHESDPSKVSPEVLKALDSLHLPGLMRADRLEADIRSMMGWTQAATREQLDRVSETGHLEEFVSHIRRAINSKPHVLLAYSYILFMALFAGGRYMRATLESAGEDFWQRLPSGPDSQRENEASSTEQCGMPLRFFHFDTPLDGEDLRRDFKQRLADAEMSLTYQEKHDIVQEAICIFENLILLVAQLDDVAARDALGRFSSGRRESDDSLATVIAKPASMNRFRDSVAVTKERSARRSSQEMHDRMSTSDAEYCMSDYEKMPTLVESPVLSNSDHGDMMPLGSETEKDGHLGPKSVRFRESLSQRPRSHVGEGGSTETSAEGLWAASRRLHREQVTHWVIGVAIGFIILGAVLGRRAVYY